MVLHLQTSYSRITAMPGEAVLQGESIGHAFEVFGIGEDIRMAARSPQAAGVPCCVIYRSE